MKIFSALFFSAGLLFPVMAYSSDTLRIASGEAETALHISVTEEAASGSLQIGGIDLVHGMHDTLDYVRIIIDRFHGVGQPGTPCLPVRSVLFEMAGDTEYSVSYSVTDSLLIDLEERWPRSRLFPAQPPAVKSPDTLPVFRKPLKEFYELNRWIGQPVVRFSKEGKVRGMPVGRIAFSPVSYHPATNQLKIITGIRFSCFPERAPEKPPVIMPSAAFDQVLGSVSRIQHSMEEEALIVQEPLSMVILTDSLFHKTLQPFIRWKSQKGYHVIEAYTSDPAVGHEAAAISAYLENLYFHPPGNVQPPSYLLIVGDVEHVPPSSSSFPVTDLYYTTYDEPDDYIPDIFCGRISVRDTSELDAVLDKILQYEKFHLPDPSFLIKSILIAGNDSHGYVEGNGQLNYGTTYYFNWENGIDTSVYLHPDASSMDAQIRAEISSGASFVNYTGHGVTTGWVDPSLSLSHIASLENHKKYPLMIGNGCETNVFNLSSDCFAEAIVKARDKGALAYIGCTAESYWEEDFFWAVGVGPLTAQPTYEQTGLGYYDKVFHQYGEDMSVWAPSAGEMIYAGNMAVQESGSLKKEYYWKIYQLMGDPTLVPWFTLPDDPPIIFPDTLPSDAAWVSIQSEPYNYAALSVDGKLLDACHADAAGHTQLFIPEDHRGDTLLLVITGDKRKPFIRQIPNNGHFELISATIVDETILPDGELANGEGAAFTLAMKNTSGISSAEDLLIASAEGGPFTFLDSTTVLPAVPPGDTVVLEGTLSFLVGERIADGSEIDITLKRKNDRTGNQLFFSLAVVAPDLRLMAFSAGESPGGNGNNILEYGEHVTLDFSIENAGGFRSDSIQIRVVDSVTVFSEKLILRGAPVEPGSQVEYQATFVIPPEYEQRGASLIPLVIEDGSYVIDTVCVVTGKYFEDFSTKSTDRTSWSEMEWQIDTVEFFSAPASLRSGVIEDYESSSATLITHVFETDSIVFNYRVSSEQGFDHLRFYDNQVEVTRWSGETGWDYYTHTMAPGIHTLTWRYRKDQSVSRGEDAAWIDNIIFPRNAFVAIDLSIDSIIAERSGAFLNDESIGIHASNLGTDTVAGFSARYRLRGNEWTEVSVEELIPPNSSSEIMLPGTVDLSALGRYTLDVVAIHPSDNYSLNDTMTTTILHYEYPDLGIRFKRHDTVHSAHVDLIAQIENSGNIFIEDMNFSVTIDSMYQSSGKLPVDLEAGESTEVTLNLINEYQEWIETGWHDYLVELGVDSLMENNFLSGEIYWIATSMAAQSAGDYRMYPNPARSRLVIENGAGITVPSTLRITDQMGRVMHVQPFNDPRVIVELPELLPGSNIYFLEIFSEEGTPLYWGKFVFLE
jgi:hypothetical protein